MQSHFSRYRTKIKLNCDKNILYTYIKPQYTDKQSIWHLIEVKAVFYKLELEFQLYTKFTWNSPNQFFFCLCVLFCYILEIINFKVPLSGLLNKNKIINIWNKSIFRTPKNWELNTATYVSESTSLVQFEIPHFYKSNGGISRKF